MGDHLRAGLPSRHVTNQLGQPSLALADGCHQATTQITDGCGDGHGHRGYTTAVVFQMHAGDNC